MVESIIAFVAVCWFVLIVALVRQAYLLFMGR